MNKIKYITLIVGVILIFSSVIIKSKVKSHEFWVNNLVNFKEVSSENTEVYLTADKVIVKEGDITILESNNVLYSIKYDGDLEDLSNIEFFGVSKKYSEEYIKILLKQYNGGIGNNTIKEDEVLNVFGPYYLEVREIRYLNKTDSTIKTFTSLLLEIGIVLIVFSIVVIIIEKKSQNDDFLV